VDHCSLRCESGRINGEIAGRGSHPSKTAEGGTRFVVASAKYKLGEPRCEKSLKRQFRSKIKSWFFVSDFAEMTGLERESKIRRVLSHGFK
jgi:hypothetical protein